MLSNNSLVSENFFASLPLLDRKKLYSLGKKQNFQKDEFIFCAPEGDRQVHILLSGHAKIFHASPAGKEIILWFCLPGEVFGLAETLCHQPRKAFAQACNNISVISLSDKDFKQFICESPSASTLVMQLLATRLRLLSESLLSIATEDAESRLNSILVRLACCYGEKIGSDTAINFPITHQEIADMIGASRQTVTSLLNQMKKKGLIYSDKHKIHLRRNKSFTDLITNKPQGETEMTSLML